MKAVRQSSREIFRWPVMIGLVTANGLASALFGDETWDALSWVALSIPLAVLGWKMMK